MGRRTITQGAGQPNGDAPPSTIAAQIVQNQTRPAAPQQNSAFTQLLNELLNNPAAAPETDPQINVKLISVLAEAGLGPLADGNPFADLDFLIPQAIDSITVIEATIRRQPEVLFTPTSEDGPQLLLPLLARLVAVGGQPKYESLPVVRLLSTAFDALKRSLDSWQNVRLLQEVVQDCVDELISVLANVPSEKSAFSVKVPSAKVVSRLWPQSEAEIALPHGTQTTLSNVSSALVLAVELCTVTGLSQQWKQESQTRLQNILHSFRKPLQTAGQWSRAVVRILSFSSCSITLSALLEDSLTIVPPEAIQKEIATALLRALPSDESTCRDTYLPKLVTLAESEQFGTLHEDMRLATAAVICRLTSRDEVPEAVLSLENAVKEGNFMSENELLVAFNELSGFREDGAMCPTRKRRRLNHDAPTQTAASRVMTLLASDHSEDETSLANYAATAYVELREENQRLVWQGLAELATTQPEVALETASALISQLDSDQSKEIRVLSMVAIKACVGRTTSSTFLDLRKSAFGQICLRSLHSSLRELRFAAGQALAGFLRNDLPEYLRTANRKVALEYLRALSDRDIACEQDTLVTAWGYVAQNCDDFELNLALLRLVDYLGNSNPLICGLAFSELEKLSAARKQSMEELFRPFWSSVAVAVIQDLHSRPQKAQQLCDLIGIDLNQWLVQTQQDTIPTLVLTKRKDLLARIATARGNGTTIVDICVQPRTNLAAILALLIAQPGQDQEGAASACLADISPDLPDLSSLIRLDATLVACFILKHIGEQYDRKKSRAIRAFQVFASIAERRAGQPKGNPTMPKHVFIFFANHILGIMTHFSEVLENTQGIYPVQEKVRCVQAIGEMVVMAKTHVSLALPQIRAALQSSMEQPGLCEAAFEVWLRLISLLEEEDIALLLEQTFALVLRHWNSISPELQQTTHGRIGELVRNHNRVILENVMNLPSLKDLPLLSKVGAEVERLRSAQGVEPHCKAFTQRLQNESHIVVLQALKELVPYLEEHQDFIHMSVTSEQPASVLFDLLRALLDASAKFSTQSDEAADLSGKALGIIGCLDPNRIETARSKTRALVLSNFDKADETIDWVIVLLEDVLVKAFKSVTNARAQGFLAYTIQELLRFCNFNDGTVLRPRASQAPTAHQKWTKIPESVRITLIPFVKSRYVVKSNTTTNPQDRAYPGFTPDQGHTQWLRSLVADLMRKGKGDNAQMVFPLLARVIRGHDLAIASFLLPYAMLNIVLGGTVAEADDMSNEIRAVLESQPSDSVQQETVKLCSENIFSVLDYISTWLQEKKKQLGETRSAAYRTGHSPNDFDEAKDMGQIDNVERFLASIPAEVIANQAIVCGSFARALFHWEQYIRQKRPIIPSARPPQKGSEDEKLYKRLHDIYAQIDEPDGLEGISAHLSILSEEQQALQNSKAGRWTAAQTWYESELARRPAKDDVEDKLLRCLRETGQYATLLRYADSFIATRMVDEDKQSAIARLLPLVVESHWMMGDLDGMRARMALTPPAASSDFNFGIGKLLTSLTNTNDDQRTAAVRTLRAQVTRGMTLASTSSVHSSHDDLKKLHVLYEIEALSNSGGPVNALDAPALERRLSILGSYVSDKQYVLGIRRMLIQSLPAKFGDHDLGSVWLASAKLARQSKNTQQAYNAVLKANEGGDRNAKLEEARLLWRDGHQRHAIQALESSINSGIFELPDENDTNMADSTTNTSITSMNSIPQNMLAARANLLLAKWLDALGQSQAKDMTEKYQFAARHFQRWEKGHYYLGKHYQKLLEAEKALPKEKQTDRYRGGEMTRLVIENLLRSVPFGNKYWHETIPKLLTLWLDLGKDAVDPPKCDKPAIIDQRSKLATQATKQVQKYFDRVPPFVFYSAMPQLISRITHPSNEVWKQICNILTRIVGAYPNQALWSMLAVVKASDQLRVERGKEIISRVKDGGGGRKSNSKTASSVDMRILISQGQKLSDGLLQACEAHVEQRVTGVSLSQDLGFNHKLAPSHLVVPIETTLASNLPPGANAQTIRVHQPFVQDKITIASFADHVMVLSSLQRPRKLTVRGSDGKQYGLLCKPKDDLRKDQRLMEFNGIINRALKRDAESSKRRLYIKTYAVTPLSEESGTIEWVEGIKPMRDILLALYGRKGVRPDYNYLRKQLDEATSDMRHIHIFKDKVLQQFPACLHEWFTEVYPEPEAWFAARLRYARSAAVMSIVGHVLGLGDRHGENILLEEGTGGVFHVDFNCLFDKGRTFEKPEVVPFRLTHNMVDAMGPHGYEGPFRKSSELTLRLLRQSKDTLMTILETFLYDPTTDFVEKEKKKHKDKDKEKIEGVPTTPQEILHSVEGKLKGLLRGETVPLGVEGYVDALIREAASHWNLARMYIGWCAFL